MGIKYIVRAGFTLIELLIVIAILGILAAAVMIAINPNKRLQQARDATRLADTSQISESVAEYYVTHGTYPPNPSLSTETEFASDEGPNWIPGLDKLPQDPTQAGIISTLASLFDMKGNNKTTQDTAIKPQIAGTQTVTIGGNSNDGSIRYQKTSYPPELGGTCLASTSSGNLGQLYGGLNPPFSYYTWRFYLEFDTSPIPDNATISSATLRLTIGQDNTDETAGSNFTIKVRSYNQFGTLNCPDDWGSNPPSNAIIGTFNTASLPVNQSGVYAPQGTNFSIDLNGPTTIDNAGLSTFILTSDRDENDISAVGREYLTLYTSENSNESVRPQLIIEYTTAPPPEESPQPSPPPKGCKNKKEIYCYKVKEDRKSATLWAVLENEDDERIYSKPTAKCKETPPVETFLNYCIKDP